MEKETEKQIQELQILEQSLQSILMQKQAFEMELSETENAVSELEKTSDECYKLVGNIMVKAEKNALLKDLNHKKELIALRLKSLAAQEKKLAEESEKLRKKVLSKIDKQ